MVSPSVCVYVSKVGGVIVCLLLQLLALQVGRCP